MLVKRGRQMADTNVYNQTTNIIEEVFDVLGNELKVFTDKEKAILGKNRMNAIFAFRKYYRNAKYEIEIARG